MSWVKLDDAFFSNRKVRAVSVQASHLALAGLCFCAQNENDGHLLDDDVRLIANMAKVGPVTKLVEELVGVGIWEREKGGFAVHDFLEYNPSHAELEQKRVTTKKRVAAYRTRTCNGVGNGVTTSVGNGASNGVGNTTPLPIPSSLFRSGSVLLSASDPEKSNIRANEPGKPSPYNVVSQFLAIRAEVLEVGEPFAQPSDGQQEKAAPWLAAMDSDAVADIEPAIRLALQHVKRGDPGWTNPAMTKAGFLWGSIIAQWSDLREELHGCAPTPVKPSDKFATPPDWRKHLAPNARR